MLLTERYLDQLNHWPKDGRHILAQADLESVIVYQAYRPAIGHFALSHGYFGGEFNYSRMSWIKTNFLWMMYRSGWGTKEGQEISLAIRIRRAFFDDLLAQAVESAFEKNQFESYSDWEKAITRSSVRIQWDPDHLPSGGPVSRRALQIGLRGKSLKEYGRHQILEILDLSPFVIEQRNRVNPEYLAELVTPRERVYLPIEQHIRTWLRLDQPSMDFL